MPPKRKDFLMPKAKAKAKAAEPQNENDFLEAADEMERLAAEERVATKVTKPTTDSALTVSRVIMKSKSRVPTSRLCGRRPA